MIDQVDCLWSLISLVVQFFLVVRKALSMAICSNSSYLSWKKTVELPVELPKSSNEVPDGSTTGVSLLLLNGCTQENPALRKPESNVKALASRAEERPSYHLDVAVSKPRDFDAKQEIFDKGLDSLSKTMIVGEEKVSRKVRKRPSKIAIPELSMNSSFGEVDNKEISIVGEMLEVERSEYCLASRKGNRHVMEDGYGVITDIHGDSKQAFFGVFDGHGGHAAVDFVSEKLGKNIITALAELEEGDRSDLAIKAGYLTTDREFLSQDVSSGACAATVLVKNGELHVANVGDCRVVLSRKGVANALTSDHNAGREDERTRIENSGGFVTQRNGVWRVQDSLAISRAFGDANSKEWIISEPDTSTVRLTPDCEFLIMASDGLWATVSNQEAVDVVSRHDKSYIQSCKDLVNMSSSRGSRDDITVMLVDLQRFVKLCG